MQPADYVPLLDAVKREVAVSRARAAQVVNTELIGMYGRIGRLILDRQADEGWGARVVDRLATDLRTAFPGARGFSRRNLHYMRALADAYPAEIVQQPAAQLPLGQLMVLLDKVPDPAARDWYAERAAADGWSRPVLETMVASNLHRRQGSAPSNFPVTLGQVAVGDGDGGRGQGGGPALAGLAGAAQHAVAAVDIEVLDPGAADLRDP